MTGSPVERREPGERRLFADRRDGTDCRGPDRRSSGPRLIGDEWLLILVDVERRGGRERRQGGERRSSAERRRGLERRGQTVANHVRDALERLANVVEGGGVDNDVRRELGMASLRLRFALDRLKAPSDASGQDTL